MQVLIDTLDRATKPDRELDANIHTAITGKRCWQDDFDGWVTQFMDTNGWEDVPAYTASFDAALALLRPHDRSGGILQGVLQAVIDDHHAGRVSVPTLTPFDFAKRTLIGLLQSRTATDREAQ